MFIFFNISPLFALKVGTHMLLNTYIASNKLNGFCMDDYLKNKLNFRNGILSEIKYEGKPKQIVKVIQEGGVTEDDPFAQPWKPEAIPTGLRWMNHFHNPLESEFDNSGYGSGKSAIAWTFMPVGEQSTISGDYSWYDVKNYFYQALTETDEIIRNEKFAKVFRGLGQLMHMIQDMSVPEHARNTGHISSSYEDWLQNPNNFKYEGEAILKLKNCDILNDTLWIPSQIPFIFFSSAYFSQPVSFAAIVNPCANLFDNNQYDGTNPDDTSLYTNNFGLSEFTNANFLSPGTKLSGSEFPYPKILVTRYDTEPPEESSLCILQRNEYLDPLDGETEKYYSKCRHGENIKFFLKATLTHEYLDAACQYTSDACPVNDTYWIYLLNDDRIFANYAQKLIPRAIGYSAQLLEYFFFLNLKITLPEDGFYAKTNQEDPDAGFDTIKICVQNIFSSAEMTAGTLDLVIQYKTSPCDPFTNSSTFNTACRTRDLPFEYITVHHPQNIAIPKPPAEPLEIEFGLSKPIPLWATDIRICVLYKGIVAWKNQSGEIVGQENEAVEVGFKDISEPTPIHIFNNMDKICLDTISPENNRSKDWHNAGIEAIIRVDTPSINKYGNNNGKGDEFDVYAHNIKELYIRFSSIDRPQTVGTQPGEYHYRFQNIPPNTLLTQMYLLTDAEIEYIDRANNKFRILPAFQRSMVYSSEAFDDPENTADDILKEDHDLFWSDNHYTIEDMINYNITWEFHPQAIINQYNFDSDGVYSRFAPQFESFRGHEFWEGTKVINPPYHPGISCDINNPVSHCPINALNQ